MSAVRCAAPPASQALRVSCRSLRRPRASIRPICASVYISSVILIGWRTAPIDPHAMTPKPACVVFGPVGEVGLCGLPSQAVPVSPGVWGASPQKRRMPLSPQVLGCCTVLSATFCTDPLHLRTRGVEFRPDHQLVFGLWCVCSLPPQAPSGLFDWILNTPW